MNRILLVLLLFSALIYGCGKSATDPLVQYNAQKVIDDKIVSDYIASNNLKAVAKQADTSGVWYIINPGEEGTGNVLYTNSTQVTIGYTGSVLTTGYVFAKTGSFHPAYPISSMIRGLQLGIPHIKIGGKIRLLIPSRYAYGPYPQDSLQIPKNGVLDFKIQLYNVAN